MKHTRRMIILLIVISTICLFTLSGCKTDGTSQSVTTPIATTTTPAGTPSIVKNTFQMIEGEYVLLKDNKLQSDLPGITDHDKYLSKS